MCGLTGFPGIAAAISHPTRCSPSSAAWRRLCIIAVPTIRESGAIHRRELPLGHKRLSIVDLSPAGHQPLASRCGRYVIAYNGEVYNHDALRKELVERGHSFRGHSDTEVLVEGFAEWGIEATIRKCRGMFAIAVWDCSQRELSLIRDRLGKKPLYYGQFQSVVLFGSETKSLRAHPAFTSQIDRVQLHLFLRQSYLPHGASIYAGIQQVQPGQIVTLCANEASDPTPFRTTVTTYWSFDDVARSGIQDSFAGSYEAAAEQLDNLLTDAVGCRMVVPTCRWERSCPAESIRH